MAKSFSKEEWLALPVGRDHGYRNDDVDSPAVVWTVLRNGWSDLDWYDVRWNTPIDFSSPSTNLDLPVPSYTGC
jgi:hypothetical protein